MFYRRKIILALTELLGNEVEKLRLQKLLFLFSQRKSKPEYDFIPYKFGCYSYSVKADLNTMVKKGLLEEGENKYTKTEARNYLSELKKSDEILIREVVETYGEMNNNQLLKHTYLNFPFYAINSSIVHEVLPEKLMERVERARPSASEKGLFTIGYEGISLEKYLEKLIKNNIKLLIDVRKNPLSMKFGFSKSQLKKYTNALGIDYIHIPEVGIESEKRKALNSQVDYDQLFDDYKNTTLKTTITNQKHILTLLQKHHRVALTCFEAEPCQCHRTHLANSICKIEGKDFALIHL